jgi:hypothetical protein
VILNCVILGALRTPSDLRINGIEIHKYFAFVTIKQRVQIGLNLAGGYGVGKGGFTTETFTTAFTCHFRLGRSPTSRRKIPAPGQPEVLRR